MTTTTEGTTSHSCFRHHKDPR